MSILEFLFGKLRQPGVVKASLASAGTTAPSQPVPVAPQVRSGTLAYNPDLVSTLMEEHLSLLELFGTIKRASEAGDFAAVRHGLAEFQAALNLHLVVENAHFYAYLRKNLSPNTRARETMSAFFDEMQEIGKAVTQFLRAYIDCGFTPEQRAAFAHELEGIGAALVSRIEREEQSLYRLYQPAAVH